MKFWFKIIALLVCLSALSGCSVSGVRRADDGPALKKSIPVPVSDLVSVQEPVGFKKTNVKKTFIVWEKGERCFKLEALAHKGSSVDGSAAFDFESYVNLMTESRSAVYELDADGEKAYVSVKNLVGQDGKEIRDASLEAVVMHGDYVYRLSLDCGLLKSLSPEDKSRFNDTVKSLNFKQ